MIGNQLNFVLMLAVTIVPLNMAVVFVVPSMSNIFRVSLLCNRK